MQAVIGSEDRPLRVAIIGSGPSGFYAADFLLNQSDTCVEVDMFERLPTPYGLVRAGVAPDHQQIKSVVKIYDRVACLSRFRFWGNLELGKDFRRSDLHHFFDAIIYAMGAQSDRSMNIPGEQLEGSFSATQFVGWYNGHPDYRNMKFDFSNPGVAIVGVGNVALDIARILARTNAELAKTDIANHALEQLVDSRIRNIYIIARRGPLQSAFTSAGTREFAHMDDAVATVDPKELKLESVCEGILKKTEDKRLINNFKFLDLISKNGANTRKRCIQFLFRRSPVEIISNNGRVDRIKLVRNELFEDEAGYLKAKNTGVFETLNVGLVFRSIGYRSNPVDDVPYDSTKGIIANEQGRVIDPDSRKHCQGEYTVGWAKRGPTGTIGTNKPDSKETGLHVLEDFAGRKVERLIEPHMVMVKRWLNGMKIRYVSFEDWRLLDRVEVREGGKQSRPREKITAVEDMLKVIEKEGVNPDL